MSKVAEHIRSWLQAHPKHVVGALGVLLLGTGVTAFGVAPLERQLDAQPVRQITEAVEIAPEALAATAPGFVLYRSDVTRRDDTAQTLLSRLGVTDRDAVAFLRTEPAAQALFKGAGKLVTVEADDEQRLQRLTARWLPSGQGQAYQRFTLTRDGDRWVTRTDTAPLQASVRLSSGTIRHSLFAATDEARLPDSVASQLADLFSGDIDFRRDLRAGDRFNVVYEAFEADGEVLRYGRVLAAEFVNDGKTHQLVWFEEPNRKGAYYTFAGESLQRMFLSSPLAFSRVSSSYGLRFHPISGHLKPHLGIDYAAPTGTPVRTVGDGVVEFAGWQRGYGNVVYIGHKQEQTTVYAHLHRIDVRRGERVSQGDQIGLVGSTGASTGPHLHFEYRVRGQHQDPLTIARNSPGEPITASSRARFNQVADAMKSKLSSASTLTLASAE